MAEGGEGEQDDVSFLRTVNYPLKTILHFVLHIHVEAKPKTRYK